MHITADERRLLQLLAAGSTNKEAANQIGFSLGTIESMRQALMNKLGAQSPAQLGYRYAKWLQQHSTSPGVVEGDGSGDGGTRLRL